MALWFQHLKTLIQCFIDVSYCKSDSFSALLIFVQGEIDDVHQKIQVIFKKQTQLRMAKVRLKVRDTVSCGL